MAHRFSMNKNILVAVFFISSLALITGCETEEDNAIAEAMQCLNDNKNGSESKAQDCYEKVDGIDSTDASYIRCLSIYNMRGLFTESFVAAFDALEDTSSSLNTNVEMMAVVQFTGTDAETGNSATEDGEEVLDECSNSGSPGFTMISGITRMATVIGGATAAAIDGNLAGADPGDLGEAAKDAYSAYCEGSTSDNEFCSELEAAGADGSISDEDLGTALITQFGTNN